jgi:hypothetical protein
MAPRFSTTHSLFQRDTIALPAKLLQSVPACAQECVSSAVNSTWVPSKCEDAADAACLCSHYSTSGFTVGELALGCVYSNCSESVRSAYSKDAFGLCTPYTQAVSATHTVLTLTTMAMSTTPTLSSPATRTTAVSTSLTATSIITSILRPTMSAPSSTTTWIAATSTPTQGPKGLTTGQTIGISVAAISIAALLFGLCFFCCCCVRGRRKKDKKKDITRKKSTKSSHRLDFQDMSSPTGSKFPSKGHARQATASPEGPVRPPRSFPSSPTRSTRSSFIAFAKSPETVAPRRYRPSLGPQREWWKESSRPDVRQVPEGLRSHRASISSPMSEHDTRSPRLSTLMANVALSLKQSSGRLRPDSAATRWTLFEEDGKSSSDKKVLPDVPVLPSPVFLPGQSSPAKQFTKSSEDMSKSGLMLQIPRKPVHDDESPTSNGISLSAGLSRTDHLSMPPSSAASYLPAYYTSSDSRTPVATKWSPIDHERFGDAQVAPMPLMARGGVRSSWTSATTFESVDPDETTPENEVDKQLTPVSYPKVPRPSNQAIPRSPLSVTSSEKPTLAAKRRGEDLSLDLGRGRVIAEAREAAESPLKGYERGLRRNNVTPQMVLKSPLWEPKLTPSRRGGDLYLSVEPRGI